MSTIHPSLAPAVTASIEEAKGTPFVDESGAVVDPPTTAQMLMLFKAYQGQVDAILGQLSQSLAQQLTTIGQLTAVLTTKASASSVADVRQNLTGLATTVAGKADTTYVDGQVQTISGLDAKQTADIQGLLKTLSDEAPITQSILSRLGTQETATSTLQANASTYALASTVSNLTGQVTAVRNTQNDSSTGLVATKAIADAAAATLSTLTTTTLPGLKTDIGNRLRKDQADATTYPLAVPVAAGMDKAVQKSELVGGIQRPYRVFQNVGATPVGAYVRSGQVAAVSDGLGLGQVYALTTVRLKTVTAPLVASIVKVYANGTEAYSTTVALATVAAVGKTLDLLALTGAALPADITLPATLTCSASAGTFEIILDGILK